MKTHRLLLAVLGGACGVVTVLVARDAMGQGVEVALFARPAILLFIAAVYLMRKLAAPSVDDFHQEVLSDKEAE
jgi:hypothetical protein